MRLRLPTPLLLAALFALAACREAPPDATPAAGEAAEVAASRNIVLLTLDTTRADHLGAWGWPHAATPRLDALAARGVRFARCDTAAPITLPSHATILTGLYPPRHGVRDNATFTLGETAETVTERLAAGGYDTAAVVSAAVLARRYGLDQGFAAYDDDLGAGGDAVAVERPASATTDAALEVLSELAPPFFLWVHYFDPHDAYAPPPEHAGRGGPTPLYDGEIAYMGSEIGRLLDALPAGTAVVAVGDHGEMLGDHGEPTHGLLLFSGARRVPLLVAAPGLPEGRTVDCLVRTADVAPTLLELAGQAVPTGLDGESLLPLAHAGDGDACARLSYAESFLPYFAYGWFPPRALSDGRWLYLDGAPPGLYDLAAADGEATDLASRRATEAAAWRERLTERVAEMGEELGAAVAPERTLDAEERRRLAALGYVAAGGGAVHAAGELPDPRAMTDVARAVTRAGDLVETGRFAEALRELSPVLRRDPGNFPALDLAGLALSGSGRCEDALGMFDKAAGRNPQAAGPPLNAGHCLLRLGRPAEAEAAYRRALALDPAAPGAAPNLAGLLRARGAAGEAAAVLEAAFAAGSRHPGLYFERGMLAAEQGDPASALADFEEAAARDPENPAPLEQAARTAMAAGRWAEAARSFERLIALLPDRPELWGLLGSLYLDRLADPTAARTAFTRAYALETDPAKRQQLEAVLARLAGSS